MQSCVACDNDVNESKAAGAQCRKREAREHEYDGRHAASKIDRNHNDDAGYSGDAGCRGERGKWENKTRETEGPADERRTWR